MEKIKITNSNVFKCSCEENISKKKILIMICQWVMCNIILSGIRSINQGSGWNICHLKRLFYRSAHDTLRFAAEQSSKVSSCFLFGWQDSWRMSRLLLLWYSWRRSECVHSVRGISIRLQDLSRVQHSVSYQKKKKKVDWHTSECFCKKVRVGS